MPNQSLDWFLDNGITVDSAAAVDIRALVDTAVVSDESQNVTFTNSNQGQYRFFDPATTGNSTNTDPWSNFVGRGWAITAADILPADDRCSAFIPAQTINVPIVVRLSWSGSPSGGITIQGRCSLWRYNPTIDSGVLVASGAASLPGWNTLLGSPASGSTQATTMGVACPETVIERDEILLLQVGLGLTTTPGPLLGGTVTYTAALAIGGPAQTRVEMQGAPMRQTCQVSDSAAAQAVPEKDGLFLRTDQQAPAVAAPDRSLLIVSATRDVVGAAQPNRSLQVSHTSDQAVGQGTGSRRLAVGHGQQARAEATATRRLDIAHDDSTVGAGASSFDRYWDAIRFATANAEGVTDFDRTVIFVRRATAVAVGNIDPNESRINLPISDLPSAGDGGTVVIRKIFPIFS